MEEKIINMNQFLGAAQGDQEHMLGKFLYSRYRRWRKRSATMRTCCSGNWTGWMMSFPS